MPLLIPTDVEVSYDLNTAITRRRGNRVFDYRRVSTAREVMISPEIQGEANEQAMRREGLVRVGDPIEDLDRSGRDFAKRKIRWMIDEVRADRADGIMIYNVSRWGRNMEQSAFHLRELAEAGGFLVSATEPLGEVHTPNGKYTLNHMLALAEMQSGQIQQGWLSVFDYRRRLGLPNTNTPRFGYVFNPEAPVHVHLGGKRAPHVGVHVIGDELGSDARVRADFLARAYEWYADARSLTPLLDEMAEQGITTSGGKVMPYSALLWILDSGFAAGFINYNMTRGRQKAGPPRYFPGAHEPVIDMDLWQAYAGRRNSRTKTRAPSKPRILTGLGRCGSCGYTLTACYDDSKLQYRCGNSPHSSYQKCPANVSVRAHILHGEVMAWAVRQRELVPALRDEFASRDIGAKSFDARIKKMEAVQARLTRELRGYARMLAATDPHGGGDDMAIPPDIIRSNAAEATETLRDTQAKLAELRRKGARRTEPPTPEIFDALIRTMRDGRLNPAVANAAVAEVVSRVVVFPAHVKPRVHIYGVWEDEEWRASEALRSGSSKRRSVAASSSSSSAESTR